MRRKETTRRKKRISNRKLSEKYYYVGEEKTVTGLHLTQYDAHTYTSKTIDSSSPSFKKLISPNHINWLEVRGLTNDELISRLAKEFGLHNVDAKDILTPQHVAKIEEYNGHLLIVMNTCYYNEEQELCPEHIALLVLDKTIITFTERDSDLFEPVHQAINNNLLSVREKPIGLLTMFLLNTLVANSVDHVSRIEEALGDLEETLLDPNDEQKNIGPAIQRHRREYMLIRRNSQPLKEQFPKLLRTDNGIVTPDLLPVYYDLQDQLLFILQTTESCREITSSLVDLYIANNDLRMNRIMKRLTVVSTIFIPLTFLAGIWGMNFKVMPELDWRYGYATAWAIMILTAIGTWLYMKRKDWY